MPSANSQKKAVFDPTLPPPTPFIYPRPRYTMVGTEEHKVRTMSVLLPDSPFASSSPPNGDIFVPRLNGGRQLYIEQSEPAWMTGAHGQQKPVKNNLQEVDWRNQHPALRARNLSRNFTTSVYGECGPACDVIDVDPEAFEQDSAKLSYAPETVLHRELYEDPDDIGWPKLMIRSNDLEIIGPSPLRNPIVAYDASANRSERLSNNSRCICTDGRDCPAQGSSSSEEGEYDDIFVFPMRQPDHQPKVSEFTTTTEALDPVQTTYEEAISTTYAILNGNSRERSPDGVIDGRFETESSKVPKKPALNGSKSKDVSGSSSKEKSSRMKLFGKGITLFNDWRKKPKVVKLEKMNVSVVPEVRHYEGCILCTPQPSPHSSVTGNGIELYAPSRQNPGPPPHTPLPSPPSPKGKEIEKHSENLTQSYPNTPLFPASFNNLRDIVQFSDGIGSPGPSNWWIEKLSTVPQQPLQEDHGPYNTSTESFHDQYGDFSSGLGWPSGTDGKRIGSLDSGAFRPDSEYCPNLSPSGSIELLTGTRTTEGCGKKTYPGRSIINGASNSKNPVNDEIIPNKKRSIFSRRTPTPDLESGINRLPSSNSPIFPGRQGTVRLPDQGIPHPGERRDHQAMGAEGVYEMVDLGAAEPTQTGSAAVEGQEDTRSVWEKLKKSAIKAAAVCSSVDLMKTEMRRFWDWVLAQKREVLYWTLIFIMFVPVVILICMVPIIFKLKASQPSIELVGLEMSALRHNLTTVNLDIHVTSKDKDYIGSSVFLLSSDSTENGRFMSGLSGKPEIYGTERFPALGALFLPESKVVNGELDMTLFGFARGISDGFEVETESKAKALAELFYGIVWGAYDESHGMSVIIEGDLHFQAKGMQLDQEIRHELVIHAMGGFQELKVDSYELMQPGQGFFDATLSWFNPSNVSMELGDAEFDITFDGILVGRAAILGFKIQPGRNNARLSSTLIEDSPLHSDETLLGELMSSLFSQASGLEGHTSRMLRLEGIGAKVNGIDTPYLQPVIKGFSKNLLIPRDSSIFASFDTHIHLSGTERSKLSLRLAGVVAKVKLPFESTAFPVSATKVTYNLRLALPSGKSLELPDVGGEGIVYVDTISSSGVHTFKPTPFNSTIKVSDSDALGALFLPEIAESGKLSVELTGEMNLDIKTPLGDGRVTGVVMERRMLGVERWAR